MMLSMIFSPFVGLAAPLIIYVHFKLSYLRLKFLKIQPERRNNYDVSCFFSTINKT
jgi:hypothetical protein